MKKCMTCGNEIAKNKQKFCSDTCKCKFHRYKRRDECRKEHGFSYQSLKGLKKKLRFIEEFGGCCSKCGYSKNVSALEFHHLNPYTKKFNIDMCRMSNMSNEAIKEEIEKCVLICSNCHQEIHNPALDMERLRGLEQLVSSRAS